MSTPQSLTVASHNYNTHSTTPAHCLYLLLSPTQHDSALAGLPTDLYARPHRSADRESTCFVCLAPSSRISKSLIKVDALPHTYSGPRGPRIGQSSCSCAVCGRNCVRLRAIRRSRGSRICESLEATNCATCTAHVFVTPRVELPMEPARHHRCAQLGVRRLGAT